MNLLSLSVCLFACCFSEYSELNDDCSITIIERRNGLPQIFIETHGTLYSMAHYGDSLLENRKLDLHIAIPKGISSVGLEQLIREKVTKANLHITKLLFLHTIYFDSNSSLIRNDASAELDKLIDLMQQYSFAKVEVIVNADNRGSAEYNRKLAAQRGNSIKVYLSNSGLDIKNVELKISGEEELIVSCPDNASCDEMIHQMNRRAEFIFNLN